MRLVLLRGAAVGFTALTMCLLAESPAAAQEDARDLEARIAAVEMSLAPRIVIAGEPRPQWTLADRLVFHGVPGVSIAVFVDGELAWAKGYGVRSVESGEPVDAETLFQAASISKPVAAIAALRLVERGALALDEPVNDRLTSWHIPDNDFTTAQPVTLRHVLSHSGGLTVSGFPGYASGAPVPTTVQILNGEPPANSPAIVVDAPPGQAFRYAGGGYTVLQQLIEDVTGQPFRTALDELVIAPAGMSHSRYEQPLSPGMNAASAHGRDGALAVGGTHTYPELAAAGLWTTPTDIMTLTDEILDALAGADGALLGADLADEMLSPQPGNWGLGFTLIAESNGDLSFGHGGSNIGFRSQWLAYKDGHGAIAIMTNSDSGGDLITELIVAICSEYGWSCSRPVERTTVDLSAEAIDALAGVYRVGIPGFGPMQVMIADEANGLMIEAPPFTRKQRLYATSETDLFMLGGQQIKVVTDDAGRPSALDIVGSGLVATKVENASPQ